MARRLKMAEVTTILTLHASGHSHREIARLVGVHRETVARYVAEGDSKPAKPDHRVGAWTEELRASRFDESDSARSWSKVSAGQRESFRTCATITDFTASYSSVRRFIRNLRKTTSTLPLRRIGNGSR